MSGVVDWEVRQLDGEVWRVWIVGVTWCDYVHCLLFLMTGVPRLSCIIYIGREVGGAFMEIADAEHSICNVGTNLFRTIINSKTAVACCLLILSGFLRNFTGHIINLRKMPRIQILLELFLELGLRTCLLV